MFQKRFQDFPMTKRIAVLHENIRTGVRQSKSNQASTNEHGRRHEDRDGFGDANQRAENQVPQHRSQLAKSVTEPETCPPVDRRNNHVSCKNHVKMYLSSHLLTVGKDSVVTTSREFQAEMLRPL